MVMSVGGDIPLSLALYHICCAPYDQAAAFPSPLLQRPSMRDFCPKYLELGGGKREPHRTTPCAEINVIQFDSLGSATTKATRM